MTWTAGCTFIVLLPFKLTKTLRVSETDEELGSDITKSGVVYMSV